MKPQQYRIFSRINAITNQENRDHRGSNCHLGKAIDLGIT